MSMLTSNRPLAPDVVFIRTVLIVATLCSTACSTNPPLSPAATAARGFRPLGAIYFLPDRVPVQHQSRALLVPDSKIEWDVRVFCHELGLGGVEIAVREQIVTLGGVVPTEEAKQTLLERVKNLRGVAGVRDTVKVVP